MLVTYLFVFSFVRRVPVKMLAVIVVQDRRVWAWGDGRQGREAFFSFRTFWGLPSGLFFLMHNIHYTAVVVLINPPVGPAAVADSRSEQVKASRL